jgi:hypothetical protein
MGLATDNEELTSQNAKADKQRRSFRTIIDRKAVAKR